MLIKKSNLFFFSQSEGKLAVSFVVCITVEYDWYMHFHLIFQFAGGAFSRLEAQWKINNLQQQSKQQAMNSFR